MPWLVALPPGAAARPCDPMRLPRGCPRSARHAGIDLFLHLLMPVTVLTIFNVSFWSRFPALLHAGSAAPGLCAHGARQGRFAAALVINKHALRNALIPFHHRAGADDSGPLRRGHLTETVFAWPGMGRLFNDALQRSDYNIALAFIYITTILTVIATLLGDILYAVVDPRIRYS